jgi:hypothetical protein
MYDHEARARVFGNKLYAGHDGICVAADDERLRHGGNECFSEEHERR